MNGTFDLQNAYSVKAYRRAKLTGAAWWHALDLASYGFIVLWLLALPFGPEASAKSFLGLLAAVALLWLWIGSFLKFQARFGIVQDNNLANYLDVDTVEFLLVAQKLATQQNIKVDAAVLWLALGKTSVGQYFLVRAGYTSLEEYSPLLKAFWQKNQTTGLEWPGEVTAAIAKIVSANQNQKVTAAQLLQLLAATLPLWQEILKLKKLDVKDAQSILAWYTHYKKIITRKSFWEKDTIEGGIGRDWSFGYTPNLLNYGRDLTLSSGNLDVLEIHGHEKEVRHLAQALAKSSSSNALLVGDHGVGKKTVVYALSRDITKGRVTPVLWHKHIWEIDTGRLLAGAERKGEIETRLKTILDEAVGAGDIILFIDDIHALFSHKEKTGAINATEIIMPYLQRSNIQVIGATTLEQFHTDIESNPGLVAAFEKIEVNEPPKEDVVYVLEDTVPAFEAKYGLVFTYAAIKEAVSVSERYIHDKPFPRKAVELIDNVATAASGEGVKIVTPEIVDKAASVKAEVPVGEVSQTEKEKLLKLEEILHHRVVGQDEAVDAVAAALKRARSGLQRKNKPIGTFLFVGPTGVGKTETAKALAEAYFSSENKMIRLDMSEYQNPDAVNKLIGGAAQSGEAGTQGNLTKAVKDSPFTVVLLDEIEKANAAILNLFLQVLDDGRLTDGTGHTVDFSNTIIIATSNAGSEVIRQLIQKNTPYEAIKKQLLEFMQQKNIFRPEFLNRFDEVIAYRPLKLDEILKIVDIMIAKVNADLAPKRIKLSLTPIAKQKIAQIGYNPTYGARPLQRAIQDKIETPLAERMLREDIAPDTTITVDDKDIT